MGEKGSGVADGAIGGWPGRPGITGQIEKGGLIMRNETTSRLPGQWKQS